MATIRVGPAGWKYKDWEGVVYPRPKPRGFDELEYISRYFDTVEINTSFYGPPTRNAVEAWLEAVRQRPNFRFTAKLYRGFTHLRRANADEERIFRDSIGALMGAGKFGALLMQFPWSFKNDAESRELLFRLIRKFREFPLVAEVRHASWITDEMLDGLAEAGVGICNIDQPLFHRSVEPSALTTSPTGYVRLHGRNYKQWFSKTADVRERYDYLYPAAELAPWTERIEKIAGDAPEVFAITNNHNIGKAVTNALEILSMLGDEKVDVPPPLLEHYPELAKIATAGSSGKLF